MDTELSRSLPEIESIVARAMAKAPADRYQSPTTCAGPLVNFLEQSKARLTALESTGGSTVIRSASAETASVIAIGATAAPAAPREVEDDVWAAALPRPSSSACLIARRHADGGAAPTASDTARAAPSATSPRRAREQSCALNAGRSPTRGATRGPLRSRCSPAHRARRSTAHVRDRGGAGAKEMFARTTRASRRACASA
jgi:hypothetical protein